MWNAIRRISRTFNIPLPNFVIAFDKSLAEEEEGTFDAHEGVLDVGEAQHTLSRLAHFLNDEGEFRISEGMAGSAIRVYALRNKLCHRSDLRHANARQHRGRCP